MRTRIAGENTVEKAGFGHINLIDPHACGTSEIVYHILKLLTVRITSAMAMAIYTGVMMDTGSLRFQNTNAAAFAISAEMATLGVCPHLVARHLYGRYSLDRIKILSRAIESLEISEDGRIAVMTLTREILADFKDTAFDESDILAYAKRIEGVRLGALILECRFSVMASGASRRSFRVLLQTDGTINASGIAAVYGGRGRLNHAEFHTWLAPVEIRNELLHLSNADLESYKSENEKRITA